MLKNTSLQVLTLAFVSRPSIYTPVNEARRFILTGVLMLCLIHSVQSLPHNASTSQVVPSLAKESVMKQFEAVSTYWRCTIVPQSATSEYVTSKKIWRHYDMCPEHVGFASETRSSTQ